MFVLMNLIAFSLQSIFALCFGMKRAIARINRAIPAMQLIAKSQTHPLAPLHAPTLRLIH